MEHGVTGCLPHDVIRRQIPDGRSGVRKEGIGLALLLQYQGLCKDNQASVRHSEGVFTSTFESGPLGLRQTLSSIRQVVFPVHCLEQSSSFTTQRRFYILEAFPLMRLFQLHLAFHFSELEVEELVVKTMLVCFVMSSFKFSNNYTYILTSQNSATHH